MNIKRTCSKHPDLEEIVGKCKACNREYQASWYQKNKEVHQQRSKIMNARSQDRNQEFVYNYLLDHPCVDCGETDPIVLDFDHLSDKEFGITRMIHLKMSLKKIQAEIDKCEVVCANDHRRRTAQRRESFKYKKSIRQ